MASLCKRQQCTIERRGFRQDLDSWRHKLIHCVGFESILEGLFGSRLVEDLTLFKGSEPEGGTDWSFDENCLFCCVRRDKVKEHLVGLNNQGLESGAEPLLVKDQTKINRLEKQAEEFFNAVLYKKDVPSFSDPHIPGVALDIMQRMIRQFAAEYTSKSSSSTPDSRSTPRPGPHSDQSLPPPPSLPTVPPAASPGGTATPSVPSQNPVLSKLLMADQDLPLDLTVKKPLPQPVEQDGVLDLSVKKGRSKSSTPSLRSPHLSQTSTLKGECLELTTEKARDLQSTSTLEQFMTKLCLHHQRQIVDALGFLQTEVKAISSSSTSLASASKPSWSVEHGALQGPSPAPCLQTPERGRTGQKLPLASTPKGSTEGQERLVAPEQTAVLRNVSGATGPALDLRKPGPGESKALATLFRSADNSVSKRLSDHAPLKIKIMKSSSLADGKKLSCVLTTSLPAGAGTLEEMQGISDSSTRADTYSAGQGSSVKRHDHADRSTRQRGSIEHTKDTLVKQSPPEKTPNNIPPVSPGTARKTIKGSSYHRPRATSSVCRFVTDPDLGHCDIVYIDKPITECFRERQHRLLPRRNARKSTRGHMYVEEMWELKTVRTLAKTSARNDSGNCPTPMPEPITLVTPKQVPGKPEGLPLGDMPFVGGFVETVSQKTPSELPAESEVAGDVEAAAASASEMALIVETSQTDQSQCKEQTAPSQSPPVDNEQSTGTNSEQPRQSLAPEDNLAQTVVETPDQDLNSIHNYIVLSENPEQVVMGKDVNLSQDKTSEEAELVQDMLQSVPEGQKVVSETQQESASLTPSLESNEDKEVVSVSAVDKEVVGAGAVDKEVVGAGAVDKEVVGAGAVDKEVVGAGAVDKEVVGAGAVDKVQAMPLEPQISIDQKPSEGSGGEANAGMEVPAESERIEVQETGEVEPDLAPGDGDNVPEEEKTHVDLSSKKVSKAVERELPLRRSEKQGIPARVIPSRVKEAAVIDTESMIICGYVNGRPIGHSDRCLRERPARTTPESTPTKTKRPTKASLKQTENPSENAAEIPQVSPETPLTPIPAGESVKSPSSKRLTKASLKQSEKYSENMPEVPQVSLPSAEVIKSPVSKRPKRTPKAKITQNLPDTQTPAEASQNMSDSRTPIAPITASQSIPDTPQVPDTPVNSSRRPESRQPLRSARLQQAAAVASPLVPDASPLVPDASPLVPDASPLVPDASPLVPDASPLVPDASPLVPDASPLVHDASPLVPDASPFDPDASPLVPDASPLVPDASPLVPDASPLVPDASPLVPDASPLVPDASPLVPDASPLVPDASPLVPDASPLVPVASPLVPDAVPDASPLVPDASPLVPDASRLVPDAPLFVPDASPSVEGAVTFIVAPEPSTSLTLPSTELNPPLPIAYPLLPIVSHLFPSSHQNSAVTQSSAELKVQKAQPAPNAKPSETEKTAEETRVQTRPKLRSSMMVAKEVEIVESQQVSSEDSALTEGTSIKKSEAHTQSSPLRSKRTLKKDGESRKLTLLKNSEEPTLLKKAEAPTLMDDKTSSECSSRSSVSSASDKPGRMPLRSESSKTDVASQSITLATPPTPVENRKSALRVQRSPTPSTSAPTTAEKWSEVASPIRLKSPVRLPSPIRFKPERIIKSPLRESPLLDSSPLPSSSVTPLLLPKLELPVQTRHKFLELLDVVENQQKISSLNTRFDKMQRGWVQMDKEGHPTPRHKNKADRQAAIWKSKRRVRKPKSSDHQRYSLVQMLFKNDLDLASICHWYMESTETQSLVIVKKVNTRLPSETQLLFPGMSQRPSQGVFPSLQAERLKKHLKKFAMASPVKSNPKSQKLIAKALEQEVSTSMPKGKEKRELTTATRISTKAYVSSTEAQVQPADGQKASAKAKNPASARILRKYSNIREKMQGQQSSKNPKGAPRKELEVSKVKPSKKKLAKPSKLKPAIAQRQKLSVSGDKSVKETSVVKTERAQPSPSRKPPVKAAVLERSVKISRSSRTLRDLSRKESASPQRSPQRVMTPKAQKNTPAPATVPKTDFNKQQVGAEKAVVDKTMATKGQTKRPSQSRVFETKVTESKGTERNGAESAAETPQQNMDVKTPGSPDQVLTRSQRKMEATPPPSIPQSASPKPATKKANEPAQSGTPKGATKRALEPTHTVSTSPKPAIKRASEPAQSGTPKGATKRSQESPQTPAKRTRTSLQK
ncbi:titin isoform X3 [Oncorhynchus kisutch]|uniref:titin isoform X2 n=1 Tax=Oncorhynchus kisutch TaxID=8019 RepID=UPI0012DDF2BB|nr:titin isoform X2 [Oncorhynchus kisutch]XP_031660576.1 titin isoform X3 [Oncorhynchus kisutch]